MSVDGTSVFEMREMAQDSDEIKRPVKQLIRPEAFEHFPHRDYDELKRVLDEFDDTQEIVAELDTNHETVRIWADIYGLEYQKQTAALLERISPEQVGGD